MRKPFTDDQGNIKFGIRALGGVVFILPDPKYTPEALGGLVLPESIKRHRNTGVVLSCGKGIVNKRTKKFEHGVPAGTRVHFESSVPWEHVAVDPATGEKHKLVVCNILDVVATEE